MTPRPGSDRTSAPETADSDLRGTIELRGVRFSYPEGAFRLRIDSLTIPAREKTVVIGPSGSGKTTLLYLIAGILPAQEGQVVIAGNAHSPSDAERRAFRISSVGMIFQEFELLEHLTVKENILLPYYVHSSISLTTGVADHLRQLTARAGLSELLPRKPRGLSHGERQRVAICRALIARPAIVLADEPTGNLDPDTTREILDSIFDEVSQSLATLVMVTHDHSLIPRFDRVIDFRDFRESINR